MSNINNSIENELYKTIRRMINHPNSSICKHYASILIINAMINSGIKIDEKLIELISQDSEGDMKTLVLLNNLIN